MSLFVDTSVWYAAADSGDRSNSRAKDILLEETDFVTTDHVLVESWLLIHHKLGRPAAESFWEGLRGGVSRVEPVEAADLDRAWDIGRAFEDQDFSIVDRTSFAVMQRLGLYRAAAFDSDFMVYRFGPRRTRAFTIIS